MNKNKLILLLILVILFLGGSFLFLNFANSASSDAIAMRVFPNPKHISALDWYRSKNFSGSPQSILVDGYEAVRDGHSVYVNVANINGTDLYTNIYLITYNQDADNETGDIFGNILKNWKFNSNISGSGFCVGDTLKNCLYDSECLVGDYCNSLKARVIRDTRRLSDLAGMNLMLEEYYQEKATYPKLTAGSYLPGKSLSVWPSWNSTLSSELGNGVPKDPVNKIGPCGSAGYNEDTCWNDVLKRFVLTLPDLPDNSLVYGYFSVNNGADYNLCGIFETPYTVQPPLGSFLGCSQTCLDFDGDGYGLVGSTLCSNPQADCNDTPVSGFGINPGATDICGDGIDQDCNGSDLACAGVCVDVDGDAYDNCDPTNSSDTDGQPADCDDTNPDINPGESEICDGINNNCSGAIDEGCDSDNDNYCSCSRAFVYGGVPLSTCTQTITTDASTVATTCDCDDTNIGINPGAVDVCDGIDNNCSSSVDENCDLDGDGYCGCSPSQGPTIVPNSVLSATCSNTLTWPASSIGSTCDCNDALGNGSINPGATEICGDGIDQDCNGIPDDGCGACTPADTRNCGINLGECSFGTETCDTTGNWGACVGGVTPIAEVCGNSLDEDCDGLADAVDPDCPVIPICGNNVVEVGEDCDDGNAIDGDGCNASTNNCLWICGDGACAGGETGATCPGDCGTPPVCGNNVVEVGEDCDDGNAIDGDGCNTISNNCLWACGDGICNNGETSAVCASDCPAGCLDGDLDTFLDVTCGGTDCDDSISWIFPGATETCDTYDNNCSDPDHFDGVLPVDIDEGCDDDGDGYCDGGMFMYNNNSMCLNTPFNFPTDNGKNGDDCQDAVGFSSVNPGASPETNCSDSIDNDCDGDMDCADTDCDASAACILGCVFPVTLPCTF